MTNKIINIKIALLISTSVLLFSCGNKNAEQNSTPDHINEETVVELTPQQTQIINLKIGAIEMKDLSGAIKVNGMLDVPPQNMVSISAPMGGFVKSTELLQGMKVTKGQSLAVLQNPDYIQMQQDYLDVKGKLEYFQLEYKRQQDLSKENVNSQKTLQFAKSEYESAQAKEAGLKAKLQLMGINADKLTSSNIQSSISLNSQINGYVTHVNVNIGKYVNPTDVMFTIVDTEHLHVELTVFEKDVPKIKLGQKVRFTLANENEERAATVYLIGKEINSDRTVRIHCHMDKEDTDLIPGMYLKAYVEAGTRNLPAVPINAVVGFEGKNYVFIPTEKQDHFKMIEVTTGVSELGYTEISLTPELNKESKIVVNGAYELLSKMKNTEETD